MYPVQEQTLSAKLFYPEFIRACLGNCSCVALGSGILLRSTSSIHGLVPPHPCSRALLLRLDQ